MEKLKNKIFSIYFIDYVKIDLSSYYKYENDNTAFIERHLLAGIKT